MGQLISRLNSGSMLNSIPFCLQALKASSLKYWRRVSVYKANYRWMVEDRQTRKGEGTFQRIIVIHAEEYPNATCLFVSAEMGQLRLWARAHPLDVRTKLVKACVRYALENGWDPAHGEGEFRVELTEELLARLRSTNDD